MIFLTSLRSLTKIMKFILGTKERMTQVFSKDGVMQAATILRVAPHTVTQVRAKDKDGYEAIQVATGETKKQRLTKAELGHLGNAYKHVMEFRPSEVKKETVTGYEKGQTIDASAFSVGDTISVSAVSKGKGFQGVVKRHGFHGGPASHGMKNTHRTPGSIGATGAQRVFKGTRMAGRMGSDRITIKNLTVLAVDAKENILLVSGAVPGRRGTIVEVRSN
jgi:large subunit ribosomal protein L3